MNNFTFILFSISDFSVAVEVEDFYLKPHEHVTVVKEKSV